MTVTVSAAGQGMQLSVGAGVYALEGDLKGAITAPAKLGASKNLIVSASGLSAVINISADEFVVGNAGFLKMLRNVAVTASFAVAGAGGLDVGAANSQVASTWYYPYVIWNGITIQGLLSANPVTPALPAGYTHFARASSCRTAATGSLFPLSYIQVNNRITYKPAAGSNLLALPSMSSGANGSVSVPTYFAVTLTSFVPPTAVTITVVPTLASASEAIIVAPNNSYGAQLSATNPPPVQLIPNAAGGMYSYPATFLLESANIYWASLGTNCQLRCFGYEDNV